MLKKIVSIVFLVAASQVFSAVPNTPFNNSKENLNIASYPKKLRDFIDDSRTLAKMTTWHDLSSKLDSLFSSDEVNLESNGKISLDSVSAAYYTIKVIEAIKNKDSRERIFTGFSEELELWAKWLRQSPKFIEFYVNAYTKIFDLNSTPAMADCFLASIRSIDPYWSRDSYFVKYWQVFASVILNANDFSDFVSTIDKLSKVMQERPKLQGDDFIAPTTKIDGREIPGDFYYKIMLLRSMIRTGVGYQIHFKNENLIPDKIYSYITKFQVGDQYFFLAGMSDCLNELDSKSFANYIGQLFKSEYLVSNSVDDLFLNEVKEISDSSEFSSKEFVANFAHDLSVLTKVYFPTLSLKEIESLYRHSQSAHWIMNRPINSRYPAERAPFGVDENSDAFKHINISALKAMDKFCDFIGVYYFSGFYKRYPVRTLKKETMDTMALFFEPNDSEFSKSFVPFVNQFDKPVFDRSLYEHFYKNLFEAYLDGARTEVFDREAVTEFNSNILSSETYEDRVKIILPRILKEMMAKISAVDYDLAKLNDRYAEALFRSPDLFKMLPDATTLKNYSGNFKDSIAELVASKKIKFTFDNDHLFRERVFELDSYKDYRDSLSLDDFAKAYLSAIWASGKGPELVSTAYFQKDKESLYSKLSELFDGNYLSVLDYVMRAPESDYKALESILVPRLIENDQYLLALSQNEQDLVRQRFYSILKDLSKPLPESVFNQLFFNLMAGGPFNDAGPEYSLQYFKLLASKVQTLNLSEIFRFESDFEPYAYSFMKTQNFDEKLLKQFDSWKFNWKKLVDTVFDNESTRYIGPDDMKKLKDVLTKNRIDFRKARVLEPLDNEEDYPHNRYQNNFQNSFGK